MNPKFAERARRFPGIITGTMIDYFSMAKGGARWRGTGQVCRRLCGGIDRKLGGGDSGEHIDLDDKRKMAPSEHMGHTHATVVRYAGCILKRCDGMRTRPRFTFLPEPKSMKEVKLAEIKDKEVRIGRGLEKLKQGAKDVEKMKIELAKQEETLLVANKDCSVMLSRRSPR